MKKYKIKVMQISYIDNVMIIYSDIDLKKAFQQKESTIHIKDEKIGNSFLLAGKIQEGHHL